MQTYGLEKFTAVLHTYFIPHQEEFNRMSKEEARDVLYHELLCGELKPMNVSSQRGGPEFSSLRLQVSDRSSEVALKELRTLYQREEAGSISITLVGESHDILADQRRAMYLIERIKDLTQMPYVIIERSLEYTYPPEHRINEESLFTYRNMPFGTGFSIPKRSMVIAAYLLLSLAGGDQSKTDNVVLFFGEEHKDIFEYLDYYNNLVGWIKNRPRTYLLIPAYPAAKVGQEYTVKAGDTLSLIAIGAYLNDSEEERMKLYEANKKAFSDQFKPSKGDTLLNPGMVLNIPPLSDQEEERVYEVKEKDVDEGLFGLAERFYTPKWAPGRLRDLYEANKAVLKSADSPIKAGMKLKIPN